MNGWIQKKNVKKAQTFILPSIKQDLLGYYYSRVGRAAANQALLIHKGHFKYQVSDASTFVWGIDRIADERCKKWFLKLSCCYIYNIWCEATE